MTATIMTVVAIAAWGFILWIAMGGETPRWRG